MEKQLKTYEYDLPDMTTGKRALASAWAKVAAPVSPERKEELRASIKKLLKEKNAVLVAHFYVDGDIQDLAEETGGCVADSLEMARFGRDCDAKTLVVAGVRFMGETAKVLSPGKRVLMPDPESNCSLDLGCPAGEFAAFRKQHPDRVAVVYANTSAAVKANADWMATSSIGLEIVKKLHAEGKKILWAPDRHLGSWIAEQTGADILLWQGSCLVHDEFKAHELSEMKKARPDAKVLVHPESPASVVAQADAIGSTSQLLAAAQKMGAPEYIVATDKGIFHKMRQAMPDKTFTEAPTAGVGATCKSCAQCPWMAMNTLEDIERILKTGENEITVDKDTGEKARVCINRMLDFSAELKAKKR